ncbi:MAG: 30S ribosome-binding factor RbfA [Rhodospirillaceae bacterium]|nr:30S ribosome-binding factor RbfA [Rhodospirillaceae bacterium]
MKHHDRHQPSQRQLRVGEQIRHSLSEILARGELHDPELIDVSITVSEVRISPDLRNATAFVVPLGGAHVGETVAALRRAAPHLRALVSRGLRLKYAPTLSFQADTSFDEADRIGQLLRSPQVVRDLHHEDDDSGEDGEDDRGA